MSPIFTIIGIGNPALTEVVVGFARTGDGHNHRQGAAFARAEILLRVLSFLPSALICAASGNMGLTRLCESVGSTRTRKSCALSWHPPLWLRMSRRCAPPQHTHTHTHTTTHPLPYTHSSSGDRGLLGMLPREAADQASRRHSRSPPLARLRSRRRVSSRVLSRARALSPPVRGARAIPSSSPPWCMLGHGEVAERCLGRQPQAFRHDYRLQGPETGWSCRRVSPPPSRTSP